jgi:hypothetical protein
MREITSGNPNTLIKILDDPGQGGANHKYQIIPNEPCGKNDLQRSFGVVNFQNGPVKEYGINGCHQEDLLAIVIDRLQSFQAGPFSCRENSLALTKCQEALHWLNHRTSLRQRRGVEGTNTL